MEAVLWRVQTDAVPDGPSLIHAAAVANDLAQRCVTVDGADLELTPVEYQVLIELAHHAGQVLT